MPCAETSTSAVTRPRWRVASKLHGVFSAAGKHVQLLDGDGVRVLRVDRRRIARHPVVARRPPGTTLRERVVLLQRLELERAEDAASRARRRGRESASPTCRRAPRPSSSGANRQRGASAGSGVAKALSGGSTATSSLTLPGVEDACAEREGHARLEVDGVRALEDFGAPPRARGRADARTAPRRARAHRVRQRLDGPERRRLRVERRRTWRARATPRKPGSLRMSRILGPSGSPFTWPPPSSGRSRRPP